MKKRVEINLALQLGLVLEFFKSELSPIFLARNRQVTVLKQNLFGGLFIMMMMMMTAANLIFIVIN